MAIGQLSPSSFSHSNSVENGLGSLQSTSSLFDLSLDSLLNPSVNLSPGIPTQPSASVGPDPSFWLVFALLLKEKKENFDWKQHIKTGNSVIIHFDKASHLNDRAEFTGSTDPMGKLLAGKNYTLKYNESNNETIVTGFNEETQADTTVGGYLDSNLGQNQLSLWGRVYTIEKDTKGQLLVRDAEFGIVGHLTKS